MEGLFQGVAAPTAIYKIVGHHFEMASPGFAEAIAQAHASHQRPSCMCQIEGVEMYVARLGDGYIVKRMPNTGSHHASDCSSYEPPPEFSGLGQVLGSAITEDPTTGETTLKLDFPMSKIPGRSAMLPVGGDSDSVATDGTKLSLRGLLHYLWDQAELTRWHPGFAGKRSWATVRKHLLQAAEHKTVRSHPLRSKLYVPEVFSVEQRDAINARRLAHWSHAMASPSKPQQLVLVIAEVKEIVQSRYGYKVVVRHVPDQAFALDERLYRRLGKRFEAELTLWGASDTLRMIMIATFNLSDAGLPGISELSLMPVTGQWVPIESAFDVELVTRLVHDERSFIKGLRYNLSTANDIANALLTDVENQPVELYIANEDESAVNRDIRHQETSPTSAHRRWTWCPAEEAFPSLPAKHAGSMQLR